VTGPAEIYEGQNTATVKIMATAGSVAANDITLKCTYSLSGTNCDSNTLTFTSREPRSLTGPSYSDLPDGSGYKTLANYAILDQLCFTMSDVPTGETFDSDRYNYVPNNWSNPALGGGVSDGFILTDQMGSIGGWPPPQNPASNPATPGTRVFDHTQHLWVGSSLCNGAGCLVKTVKQTYHFNCGRHL
jgi:hypothetical protein